MEVAVVAAAEAEAQAHLAVVEAVAQVALIQALHHTKHQHHLIQPLKLTLQAMLAAVLLLAVQLHHIVLQLNRTQTTELFIEALLQHHPLELLPQQQPIEPLTAKALLTITDQDSYITTTPHG